MTNQPKEGDLRVWCSVNMKGLRRWPVPSVEYAKDFIDRIANEQLTSDEVVTNVFGLEIYEPCDEPDCDDWCEWVDECGDDISESELVAPLFSISFKSNN
jgi:hypothetical protein